MTHATKLEGLRDLVDGRIRPAERRLKAAVARAFGPVERPSPTPFHVLEVRERSGAVTYGLADGRGVGIIDDAGALQRADAEFLATVANLHTRLLGALAALVRARNALTVREARRLVAEAKCYEPPYIECEQTR